MSAIPCISDYRPGDEHGTGPHAIVEDYTRDEAQDDAQAEFDRNPYSLVWWLDANTADNSPVDLGIAADRLDAGLQLTPPELLALALNDSRRAVQALAMLRDQYRADYNIARDVRERAAELYEAHHAPEIDSDDLLPFEGTL